MGQVSQISSSLLDLLQDMTRNWFASESQNMSPKEISEQIEQINQLATACTGIPLLPLTSDETPPPSDAIPPLQPIHPSTLQGLIPSSDANTPPAIPELGLQQAGICIEKMVELLTDHTLQKVDDALDRIQRLLGG